jgi:hypothetical protein
MYAATHYVCGSCTTTSTWRLLPDFYGNHWRSYRSRLVKNLNGNGIEFGDNLLTEAILVSDKKRPAIIFTLNPYNLIVD